MSEPEQRAVTAFRARPGALPLRGAVQRYAWGGCDYIPALLGLPNAERRPHAELWIGAHPSAPAVADVEGVPIRLDRLTEAAPEAVLGAGAAAHFGGRLPYLLKVLDARQMLSIQAHPAKAQAEEGFAREEAACIPLDAPHRCYRDNNHKPEVHVALTDFRMLHGFRPLEEIAETLRAVPEIAPLMPDFGERLARAGQDPAARRALLRTLYEAAMTMPQERADALLDPLIGRLEREEPSDKDTPGFWALRAARVYPRPGGGRDRGLFSIYLLNLVRLRPGQGTYQPAGMLHAYLEGVNVELMANSDNVLRGGLTPKHVDVPELMRTLTFEDGRPEILDGEAVSATETVYRTPAAEFSLSRIEIAPDRSHRAGTAHGPDCVIALEGRAVVHSPAGTLPLARGGVFLAPGGVEYAIEAQGGPAVLYRAAVPAPC